MFNHKYKHSSESAEKKSRKDSNMRPEEHMLDDELRNANFDNIDFDPSDNSANEEETSSGASKRVVRKRRRSALPEPPKTRRRTWSLGAMKEAFNAVKDDGMTMRSAARKFFVPESTLRDRVNGRVEVDCSQPGPPTFFTMKEEEKMVKHIIFTGKLGYFFSRNQVVVLAGDMTKIVDRIAPFKYVVPSQAWFYSFLGRWPEVKMYLNGTKGQKRERGLQRAATEFYFETLSKVLKDNKVTNKPSRLWTMDEMCVSCDSNQPSVLPMNIQRTQVFGFWRPAASVLGACSATGEKLPPYIHLRGEDLSEEDLLACPTGTKLICSQDAWTSADVMMKWLTGHLVPFLTNQKRPIVLFYDGHLQFVTVRVIERAKKEGIIMFPTPPHADFDQCTRVSCFREFKKVFTYTVDEKMPSYARFTKEKIWRILASSYSQSLTAQTMDTVFETSGIFPFNPARVLQQTRSSVPSKILQIKSQNPRPYVPMEIQQHNAPVSLPRGLYPSGIQHARPELPLTATRQGPLFRSNQENGPHHVSPDDIFPPTSRTTVNVKIHDKRVDPETGGELIEVELSETPAEDTTPSSDLGFLPVEDYTHEDDMCGVCGGIEPPNADQLPSGMVHAIDWLECAFCHRWVHRMPCANLYAVVNDFYQCSACMQQ